MRSLTYIASDLLRRSERTSNITVSSSIYEPALTPHDEAVFLLNAVAEIKHVLMVQYLFAAYSIRITNEAGKHEQLQNIQAKLLQIAREKMGHFLTVQNLLHLIGAPLNFHREHLPFASQIYPFRFKLEPLSLSVLAKYIVAESHAVLPDGFPAADRALYDDVVIQQAKQANDEYELLRIEPVFTRLLYLFQDTGNGLTAADFRLDRSLLQGDHQEWGLQKRDSLATGSQQQIGAFHVINFPQTTFTQARQAAVTAIRRIAQQNNGLEFTEVRSESHFERFLLLYKEVQVLVQQNVPIAWPIVVNPNTIPMNQSTASYTKNSFEGAFAAYQSAGRITHHRTSLWAQLFNLRYRLLLGFLQDFLRTGKAGEVRQGAGESECISRSLLLNYALHEMRQLKKIASKLVQMPKDDTANSLHAGPPFELPYALVLPDNPLDRWKVHLNIVRASQKLIEDNLFSQDSSDQHDSLLHSIVVVNNKWQPILVALASGQPLPDDSA